MQDAHIRLPAGNRTGPANGKEPPKLTLTSGQLALRDDYVKVRKDLGIE